LIDSYEPILPARSLSFLPSRPRFPAFGHPWRLFPVRPYVHPTPASTALAALDAALKPRHLDIVRMLRHVEDCFVAGGSVEGRSASVFSSVSNSAVIKSAAPGHNAALTERRGPAVSTTDLVNAGKIRAGTPSAVVPAGTLDMTSEFAEIVARSPMVTSPMMLAWHPIKT
jgi:hypothetical protein